MTRIVQIERSTRLLGGLLRRFEGAAWVWVEVTNQWEPVERWVRYGW